MEFDTFNARKYSFAESDSEGTTLKKQRKGNPRVAVVGAGYWGRNLVRVFHQLEGVDLAAVCDVDHQRLMNIANAYPNMYLTSDYAEILNDFEIEAIILAVPSTQHHKLAMASLDAGKHTFVEKPLSMSVEQGRELLAEAQAKNRVLLVGHTFLYNDAVRRVKEYIDSGELGDIYYVAAQRLNLGIVRQEENVMWSLAPHDISIINYWLGAMPTAVTARGHVYLQPGIPDVAFINLDYPGGVSANIHVSWLDPGKIRAMTVVGSKKMIVYNDTSPDEKIRIFDKRVVKKDGSGLGEFDTFGKFQLMTRAGDVLTPSLNFREPLQVEARHFVDCILEREKPFSDGKNGLEVVSVLVAAQQSMDSEGAKVVID